MQIALIVIGSIVGLILLMVLIGKALPVNHTASISEVVSLPANRLYKVLTNVENYPKWRPELKEVKKLDKDEWVELSKFGEMKFNFTELEDNKKIVATIIPGEHQQFGGSWTYELEETEDRKTILSITENGEIYSPFFRFMSKFIMGHKGTMKRFIQNLKNEIGD